MKTLFEMKKESIVTACMGSWKWQNAYRVATYRPRLAKNGKVVWESVGQSNKMSQPQLIRNGWEYSDFMGSFHNSQVRRDEAIKEIGISRVRSIEKRGYKFS